MTTLLPPGVETSPCKSCQQPVVWTTTTGDRAMPVDPEPHPNGNIELRMQAGIVRSRVVAGGPERIELAKAGRARRSHFVTCPNAGAHRNQTPTTTKETTVTPSTRKPTERQEAVLAAVLQLDVDAEAEGAQLHATPQIVACIRENIDPGADPVKVLEALQQSRKHEWIECVAKGNAKDGDAPGAHLQWIISEGGRAAFDRAQAAAIDGADAAEPDEPAVGAPPATEEEAPPWGDQRPPKKHYALIEPAVDDGAEPTVLEGVTDGGGEEGSEEPVRAGRENKVVGSQLTMKVGGPKPVASLLKIGAKQVQYAHKQFDQLQQVPFSGILEIREVGSKVADNGKAVRVHVAKVVKMDVDGETVIVETEDD